jgi:hypothetical protein
MKYELKFIDNRPCLVGGVSCILLDWYRNNTDTLLHRVWDRANLTIEDLYLCLSAPIIEDTILKSAYCLEKIWFSFPELGPYPFCGHLINLQNNRYFYKQCRDHVGHQLKVMILGLYFYHNIRPIETAIQIEMGSTEVPTNEISDEFLRQWVVASAFHDIGYIWECEKNDPCSTGKEIWQNSSRSLEEILKYPLSLTHAFSNLGLTQDLEKNLIIRQKLDVSYAEIPSYTSVGKWGGRNLLDEITSFAIDCKLIDENNFGGGKNPFQEYYEICHLGPMIDGRPPYWDHGITGAKILLHTWQSYRTRLEQVGNIRFPIKDLNTKVEELVQLMDRAQKSIVAAAGAMALHNLNPGLVPVQHGLIERGFLPSMYKIHLREKSCRVAKPLAFLLGLADTLQDWNRPYFRGRRFGDQDKTIMDFDLSIRCEEERILVSFRNEKNRDPSGEGSYVGKTLATLKSYLAEEDLRDLIFADTRENPLGVADSDDPEDVPQSKKRIRDFLNWKTYDPSLDGCQQPVTNNVNCSIARKATRLTAELSRSTHTAFELFEIYKMLFEICQLVHNELAISQEEGDDVNGIRLNELRCKLAKFKYEIIAFRRLGYGNEISRFEDRIIGLYEKIGLQRSDSKSFINQIGKLVKRTINGKKEVENSYRDIMALSCMIETILPRLSICIGTLTADAGIYVAASLKELGQYGRIETVLGKTIENLPHIKKGIPIWKAIIEPATT